MAYATTASGFIDLETLGKWDSSIILSMGITILKDDCVLAGDPYAELVHDHSIEFKFDVKGQYALGRTVDKSVMDWWSTQGEDAKKVLSASPEDLSVTELFPLWEKFLTSKGLTWQQVRWFDRNSFDMSKLQHLHEVTLAKGQDVPWNYKQVWEIATFLKFCNLKGDRYGDINPYHFKHPDFVYHSAKCDAALDALRLYKTFHP